MNRDGFTIVIVKCRHLPSTIALYGDTITKPPNNQKRESYKRTKQIFRKKTSQLTQIQE